MEIDDLRLLHIQLLIGIIYTSNLVLMGQNIFRIHIALRTVFHKELISVYWEDIYSALNCHNVAKHAEFYLRYLPFNVTSTDMYGVSKRCLQWYSKGFCVASVTKTFTFKSVQTTCHATPWTPWTP
jgi:hypothetical protein